MGKLSLYYKRRLFAMLTTAPYAFLVSKTGTISGHGYTRVLICFLGRIRYEKSACGHGVGQ